MEKTEFKGKLFGSHVEIIAYGNVDKKILEEAYQEGVRLEKIFNFYDSMSELSLLNKKRKMKVSSEFLDLLKLSLELCKKSDGSYDITFGKNFLERKSGKDLTKINCSYQDIRIKGDEVELTDSDVIIDFGSVAKGYITDKICEFLKKEGVEMFVINSRGDILVFGKIHRLDIAHPRANDKSIGSILVENCGVATSGDYKQYHEDYSKSHIVGARNYSSVTVIAPTLTEADIYATVFSLIEEKEMEGILKEKKELMVLTITKNLKMKKYNGFDKIFVEKKHKIEELFSKKKLNEDSQDSSEEWYVGDGPLNDNSREIFVRPGKKEDQEFVTKAS